MLAKLDGLEYTLALPHSLVKIPKSNKNQYLRGAALKAKIAEIVDVFSIDEKLIESLHPWDSQSCESTNGKVARKNPKDRDYTRSNSYHGRVQCAIGEVNMGYVEFHTCVFDQLGIKLGTHMVIQLRQLEAHRKAVVVAASSQNGKAQRKYHQKAKSYSRAQAEKMDGDACYQTGIVVHMSDEDEFCDM